MGKLLMKFPIYFFPMLHAFLKQVDMLMSGQPGQGQYDMFNVAELK
jgi:hypothetical protein